MYEDSLGPVAVLIWILFALAVYVYISYSTQVIARKLATPHGWFAWVPILNLFLIAKLANWSYWMVIALIIPLVNIVVSAFAWKNIAVRRGHSPWWGLGMIIPIVNLIGPGYIAFVDKAQQIEQATPVTMPPAAA
jgi:hypothetical protein